MDTDKKTIRCVSLFSISALLFSLLSYAFKSCNNWLEFISYLFLGLFGSGVVVAFASAISAKNKFKRSMNNILFNAKVTKIYYDDLIYIDKGRFLKFSQKILDSYNNFYQSYTEIEFMFFNRKFEKNIVSLFNTFTSFVGPFASAVRNNEIQDITPKDLGFYYSEARTMTKLKFYEFIHSYVDLYSLWDSKMLAWIVTEDELAQDSYATGGRPKKHETIKQIMGKR
jgi:hypothetical protein